VEYCRDADAMVIEATYLEEEADMAAGSPTLTAKQAAPTGGARWSRNLILTHVSRRYRGLDILAGPHPCSPTRAARFRRLPNPAENASKWN
jgi:ribonuclease Z